MAIQLTTATLLTLLAAGNGLRLQVQSTKGDESEVVDPHIVADPKCHGSAKGLWAKTNLRAPDATAFLRTVEKGYWIGEWSSNGVTNEWCLEEQNPHTQSAFKFSQWHFERSRACLKDRWIMIIGDSSMRMFFGALVHMIDNPQNYDYDETYYPSWREPLHANRSCVQGRENVPGCFREYVAHGVRITYLWHGHMTDGDSLLRHMHSFIGPNGEIPQPDLLLLETGIWDSFRLDEQALRNWIGVIEEIYVGQTLFIMPPSRPNEFRDLIKNINVPFLDWHYSSFSLPTGYPFQAGAHPCDVVIIEHVNMLLSVLCT